MSAKNYFKDGGRWIKGKLVGEVFCVYNAQCTEHCNGGILIVYYKSMKSRIYDTWAWSAEAYYTSYNIYVSIEYRLENTSNSYGLKWILLNFYITIL